MKTRAELIQWLINNEIQATESDDPYKQIDKLKQLAIDMLIKG